MTPKDSEFPVVDAAEDSDNQLIIECYNLEKLSEAIRRKFYDDMRRLSRNRPRFYTFKERNKGAKSIFSKVRRKRAGGTADFSPSQVSDAWGCRFVTLFQADVVHVFEDLLKYVESRRRRHDDLEIVEINVYDNRPDHDPLSIGPLVSELHRRFARSDAPASHVRRSRDTGYSSIHLVMRCTVDLATPGRPSASASGLFEIQIRDIFEEGWSEISHQLSYGQKDDLNAPSGDFSDQTWRRLLNALKTVADGCSQHASLIEPIAISLRGESSEARMSSITDLSKDKEAMIANLPEDHEALIRTIHEAYNLLEEAHQTSEEKLDRSLSAPFYRAASQKFAKAVRLAGALGDIRVTLESVDSPRPIGFVLRLEQANSAMFSLPPDGEGFNASHATLYEAAMAVYRQLTAEAPDDAFAHYRLGQACVRRAAEASGIEEGVAALRKSLQLALASKSLGKDHWLYASIPTHIGRGCYRLSRLAQKEGDAGCAREYLKRALDENNRAIDAAAIRSEQDGHKIRIFHRAVSNKLYFIYLLKETDEGRIQPEKYTDADKREISECIDLLLAEPLDDYANVYVETIDNIMIGAFILGKLDLAIEKAYDGIGFLRNMAHRKAGRKANVNLEAHLDEHGKVMCRRAFFVLTRGWSEAESAGQNASSGQGLMRLIRFWDR